MPSLTYNMSVNHHRWILSTTSGHPSRWNDKTLQLYDELLKGVYDGSVLGDFTFVLHEYGAYGNIVDAMYQGPWIMVNNGYLHWLTTVPPFKDAALRMELHWSQWLESMQKDVECTFGIMKGRFRILKTGIHLHGVEVTDKIGMTSLGR